MVTLCYLRRFLSFSRNLFAAAAEPAVEVSAEVAGAFRRVAKALEQYGSLLDAPISDRDRRRVLDSLGAAGSDYRAGLYARGFSGMQTPLAVAELIAFCDLALRHIDHSIGANRRPDGLYHAYNLISLSADGIAIRRLCEMLEGQVAVLSSGALSARQSAALLDALRDSKLYRADQNSYVLYPDRKLPGFLEKNNVPAAALAKSTALQAMIERGDRRIVVRDANGVAHFNAAFRNSALLREALAPLGLPDQERMQILALYEEVFDHQSFTGRSGAFYKYEGLGCIYWHMVAKLLLAVQEVIDRAGCAGEDAAVLERLRSQYAEIREGIGVHKPPEVYGAMPTDPYSHTPGFAGAQQPGMTGEVKEDLISRLGEMGVAVRDGRIEFRAHLLRRAEFLAGARTFHFHDLDGQPRSLELEPGSLAFTTCQVPVVLHQSGPPRIEITAADGSRRVLQGLTLDAQSSAAIFQRTGAVQRLDVFSGCAGSVEGDC
jgi:hypothetical protein